MIAGIGCLDKGLSKLEAVLFKGEQLAGWTNCITLVAWNGNFQIDKRQWLYCLLNGWNSWDDRPEH